MKKLLLIIGFLLAISYGYSQAGDICFIHTATAANISNASTFIDHPALNDNANAQIVVTHSLAGDGSVTRNDHVTGIWYDIPTGRWAVYNEDLTNMIESASFNIYVAGTQGHIETFTNTTGTFFLDINDALIDNDPNAHPIATNRYPPNNILNDNNYGFDYSGGTWKLFNEIQAIDIPADASFNVLLEPAFLSFDTSIAFTHQATAANTLYNDGTVVDHPLLNSNPDACFVVTHNYDAAGTTGSDMDVEHTLGTWFSTTYDKWVIYYETGANSMVDGAAFSVVMPHPVPENDEASGAIELTLEPFGTGCSSPVTITNVGATDSTPINGLPGCGSFAGGDVWYYFTAPPSGEVKLFRTVTGNWGALSYGVYLLPTSTSALVCDYIPGLETDANPIEGLTPGTTYGLRIWEWNNNDFGTEEICLKEWVNGAGIADAIVDGFEMYPNPVENMLNLSALNTIENVSIYNMLGQEVLQTTPATTQVEIDMSALSTGSYILKVQAGNQIGSYNLIKQ